MEVFTTSAPGQQRQPGGAADVVVAGQLAGLQDDLEVRATVDECAHGDDLVVHLPVAPGEPRPAVDHHVDLGGAAVEGECGVGQLHRQRRPARREGGGHGGDPDRRAAQRLGGDGGEVRVDADGRDRRDVRVRRVGAAGLRAEGADATGGVGALERGEVDHRHGEVEHLPLRGGRDAAAGQPGGPPLEARLVDGRQAVQEAAQGAIVAADVGEPEHTGRGLRTRDGDGRGHGRSVVIPGVHDTARCAAQRAVPEARREALSGHCDTGPGACAPWRSDVPSQVDW